jgi:hypothetical protein
MGKIGGLGESPGNNGYAENGASLGDAPVLQAQFDLPEIIVENDLVSDVELNVRVGFDERVHFVDPIAATERDGATLVVKLAEAT